MSISKLTPILVVDSVDEALPFWRDQLGYEVVHTVPHGAGTGFAILKSGGSELMLQSVSSVGDDLMLAEKPRAGSVLLYADVESLDQALVPKGGHRDARVLIARRTTAYGATESWLQAPGGFVLGLAQLPAR